MPDLNVIVLLIGPVNTTTEPDNLRGAILRTQNNKHIDKDEEFHRVSYDKSGQR